MTANVDGDSSRHPGPNAWLLDELRSQDWVPRLVRSKASKLNEGIKKLETKLGRAPTEIELAAQMEMTVPELERWSKRRTPSA